MPNFCRTRLSGITVKDIARALATIAGVKAVSDFDSGLTAGYLRTTEELLKLQLILLKNVVGWTNNQVAEVVVRLDRRGA